MMHWNQVSLTSQYLVDVWFDVDGGQVRVWFVDQILVAVGVFTGKAVYLRRFWHLLLVYSIPRSASPTILCAERRRVSLCSLEGPPADILLVGSRSRNQWWMNFAVFEVLFDEGVAGVPFLYCPFSALFNLGQAMYDQKKKMTVLIFDVLLFLEVILCQISFCIGYCFPWHIWDMRHCLECFSKKKETQNKTRFVDIRLSSWRHQGTKNIPLSWPRRSTSIPVSSGQCPSSKYATIP